MEWDLGDERDLWAEICRRSLWQFVREAWGLAYWPLRPGEQPLLTERIHKPICDWFQLHAEEWLKTRHRKNLMVILPRFFGKTTFITKAAQAWLHLHDPDLATYIGSQNYARSVDFLLSLSRVLDGSDPYARFPWLYGNWYDKRREWRRDGLVHGARRAMSRQESSFGIWAVEKGITGHHPDAGFLDDPTDYEAMASHANWLQIVNDHVASLLPVFADNALFVIVGTRYGDGDHIGTELRKEGASSWTGMPIPSDTYTTGDGGEVVRAGGKWHVYYLDAEEIDGSPTFPERCSKSFLQEFERKNHARYWAQMRNQPSRSEHVPLTREQINELWCDVKDLPRRFKVIISMDTAFKTPDRQRRGDESVMIVWAAPYDGTGNVYYLEGYGSNTWKADEFLEQLVKVTKKYWLQKRHVILTDEPEPGGKQGTWEPLLHNAFVQKTGKVNPPLYQLKRTINNKKEDRIINAAGYWQQGYVFLLKDAPGVHRLVDQMARIGMGGGRDWADAGGDVFSRQIYSTLKKIEEGGPPPRPSYPGDEILKDGRKRMTNEEALEQYDNYWREPEIMNEPI